jgi:hypothetical protein
MRILYLGWNSPNLYTSSQNSEIRMEKEWMNTKMEKLDKAEGKEYLDSALIRLTLIILSGLD